MRKIQSGSLVVFAATLTLASLSWAKEVEVKDVKYDYNKEIVKDFELTIGEKNGKKRVFDWSATLIKEIKDINVNFEVFVKKGEQLDRIGVLAENFCHIMRVDLDNPYVEILSKLFKETKNNVMHPCPYSGNLYLKNFVLEPDYIPEGVMEGEYLFNMTAYEGNPGNYLGSSTFIVVYTS